MTITARHVRVALRVLTETFLGNVDELVLARSADQSSMYARRAESTASTGKRKRMNES